MQNTKYEQIIAIDPDSEKSGVACLDIKEKEVWCDAMQFSRLMDYFAELSKGTCKFLLVVEAGYLNKKANWHSNKSVGVAGRVGENTGRNHQTARLIVEMALHMNFNVVEARPLLKSWKGHDGKITADELNRILFNAKCNTIKRSNQDERDAVLLALAYSNTPFKY